MTLLLLIGASRPVPVLVEGVTRFAAGAEGGSRSSGAEGGPGGSSVGG